MPTYEYRCKTCDHRFNLMVRIPLMDAAISEPCPSCNAFQVERLFPTLAPSIGDAVRLGIRRPDEGFKDVLRKINDANPHSTIRDTARYI